ncbi:DEAD/DEAH box helicase [Rhizobium sp. SGZ-381]|uniref:DEAD/DEAH box helicase n=1 Tax=Rhizobium sp. SGZ-381 TaxID=3342800 RepID=UPI00366C2A6F
MPAFPGGNRRLDVRKINDEGGEAAAPRSESLQVKKARYPAGLLASRLAAALKEAQQPTCYVALSESAADEIAASVGALFPDIPLLVLPPWDCLPYDRVPPSPHCMGRRMDALRIWREPGGPPKLLVTSLEAMLQRVPPAAVIEESTFDLAAGQRFDREAFSQFVRQTGYIEEGVADDPGEVVVRDGVIDIYPAGAPGPMRIVVSEKDEVEDLRGFDRVSQRTESFLERVSLGPATEAISTNADLNVAAPTSGTMEHVLCRLYENMPSVPEVLGDAIIHLAPGAETRVERYLDIIEDARQARTRLGETDTGSARSFYLNRTEWDRYAEGMKANGLNLEQEDSQHIEALALGFGKSVARLVQEGVKQGQKIVLTGTGKSLEALSRRLAKAAGTTVQPIDTWEAAISAEAGSLLKLPCALEQGFVDKRNNIVVVAAQQTSGTNSARLLLAEPELQIGDVVVHEEHGVGVLKDLQSLDINGVPHDAARLDYRDGGSLLVPMEDFGKLWRYGSEAQTVTLDRLHTEAWEKKREKIARDIQSTARHLGRIARQREASQADTFAPPRATYTAFTRRFPYAETADQTEAIDAVLSDLSSGRPMNRLICGDVGFGKTEIALRAAAAVALAGGQVVVIAPTTVLARQHFATFEQRFAGSGVSVGMLSRLVTASEAKQLKAELAEGSLGIVVATQAILAKDVRFARLALLIVDEEHRFGLRQKQAMTKLAPSLHVLAMSATPIPRTLQSAMVGIQEVSLLTTPPRRRLPVRTTLSTFDNASVRIALMREFRRGGQSFVVVPRIEDIAAVEARLRKIVPELTIRVAHGKMPAAAMDEAVVSFAAGDGDILLATNIIENGLDVPRANTIFVWHADLFGLAQLHQLRGRVGRSGTQGAATFLTDENMALSEEAQLRLSTLVENDRLGSGLSISMRDFDLRGGGDLAGEHQAGHIKAIGIGLYQTLLAEAVAKLRKPVQDKPMQAMKERTVLNFGISGGIPANYVSDPAVRLHLYARLGRASAPKSLEDLEEEFEDRFGEPPQDVKLLLRRTRLQLAAARLGIAKLEAGPKAIAVTFREKAPLRSWAAFAKAEGAVLEKNRLLFEASRAAGDEPLEFFEKMVVSAQKMSKRGVKRGAGNERED